MKILRGLPHQLEMERELGENELDYLLFNLPYACNYNCKKCFVGNTQSNNYLSLEERIRVIKEAKDLGVRTVVIPGEGEPLISPGLREMVEYQHEMGLTTIVFTNASKLDKQMARFSKEKDVSFIISFDSLRKNIYEDLARKEDVFNQVMENIRYCRKLYRDTLTETGDNRITRLALNTLANRKNKDEIDRIREWCGDDMVFICNYPVREGNAIDFWDELCGNQQEYKELQKLALEKSETKGPTSATSNNKCGYLYYGITVDSDGSIPVCPDARETRSSIGNIKETSLAKLNQRHKQLLKDFFEKHGFEPCIVRHPDYERFVDSLPSL